MNNHKREMWINNDYTLYRWLLSSKLSITEFISLNKAERDKHRDKQLGTQETNHEKNCN